MDRSEGAYILLGGNVRHYKTFMLVLFFLLVICFSKVNAVVRGYSLLGRCIFLDAGHGGRDSGAISGTFYEKDMNLILTKKLERELISEGAIVYMTRDGDYDLSKSTINRKRDDLYRRVLMINSSSCDMYISMHMNASPSNRWNGIQIFYSNILKENKDIARIVTNTMRENMRNIRDIKKENGYYMYSKLKIPGILVEAGFISNSNDNYKIRQSDYQDVLVHNIVLGIENYFDYKG